MTRRELFAALGAAAGLVGKPAPAPPVAVAKCASYESDELLATLSKMFDQLGGLTRLVKGKTVTIKLNLTGNPGHRVQGMPLGLTHYSHPRIAEAVAHLLGRSGARRIRFVESCSGTNAPLEEYLLDSGWNVRRLISAAPGIEFENTNSAGNGKRYSRLRVPGGGYLFPAYDLNTAYEETDVFVSMAKLKEHDTCGVTLSLKNCFGITPASIYGDDAGIADPNETPTKGRLEILHKGKRPPSASAPPELDASSSREAGYRVPRIVADLVAARPIDLAIVDGIQTIAGGEGPWIPGVRPVSPGVLVAGTNPVTTDAVSTVLMGFDPSAGRGASPFNDCDNTLRLAESLGIGTADLRRIEIRGTPVSQALHRFK